MQQPFEMTKREEERAREMKSTSSGSAQRGRAQAREARLFKAQPFPAHIFENSPVEQAEEAEEYKRVQKQMRAEDMLR